MKFPGDLVVVDLYPFEDTVNQALLRKISLKRSISEAYHLSGPPQKTFEDVVIIPSRAHYGDLLKILTEGRGQPPWRIEKKAGASGL